jgi:hypothetical protein
MRCGLCLVVPYIWCQNLGEVKRTTLPQASPLAFVSCPLLDPDCCIDPMCLWTVDLGPYCLASSPTALHLTCFSPWTGCHSSRGCLLSLSLGHGCHSAMPGMPPMHAGAPLYLALGCLANQLGILYRWWPGPGTPTPGHPFMWHFPISLTLSLPLSLSLSLALLLCLTFLCLGWELNSPSSLLWPNSNWMILFSLPESCKGG